MNIADGTSPAGGKPYEMKWVMMHNSHEAPTRTQVLSLIEPYLEQPIIREARKLVLSGQDEPGLGAAACRLQLPDRIDTIFCATDPTVEHTAEGDFRFAGRFGLYAEKEGKPVTMSLVGGTLLEKGDFGITLESPEFRGRIVKVDRQAEAVTVSPAPRSLENLAGAHVFITSPGRRVAHKVVNARRVGDEVQLELAADSKIGVGQVTGVEDFLVQSATPFTLQGYGYYDGARLVNAEGSVEYRINEVRSGRGVMIDRGTHPGAKADKLAAEFSDQSWFNVYDYGVGDEVVWPYAVSVTFNADGTHRVTSSAPSDSVIVRLPEGARK